jgi:hypothetical protein
VNFFAIFAVIMIMARIMVVIALKIVGLIDMLVSWPLIPEDEYPKGAEESWEES